MKLGQKIEKLEKSQISLKLYIKSEIDIEMVTGYL